MEASQDAGTREINKGWKGYVAKPPAAPENPDTESQDDESLVTGR
jgi:hypothetical protein